MEIIVATSNKHKLREIRHILKGFRISGLKLKVLENGKTFEENALKKAKAAFRKTKQLSMADDSGLMVDALNGRPGIKSARYANPPTTKNLCAKLLKEIRYSIIDNRKAKFICAIAIVFPNGETKVVKGIIKGKIAHKMRGSHGFGYDPVFIPRGFKKTFAEMPLSQKNKLSHRYQALIKAKKVLKTLKT